MAVLCRDMHARRRSRRGGDRALHVQYVVSIANSAVGAAVYGLSDCLAVGLAGLGWVAVYNPVACLLSVRTAAASPKVLTASLCSQILGMRQCHTISLYIFLFSCHLLLSFFESTFFFLFCHCAGRTQPQHINFRTDIGQPFLQPVDAVWPPVWPVQQALHGRVHFLHAPLWSACVPFLLAGAARAAVMWCRLIEIGAWTS